MDASPIVTQLLGVRAERLHRIQGLWRGYGEAARYRLHDADHPRLVVVKHILLPPDAHPRKLSSYQNEALWYQHYAAHSPARVPRFLGAFHDAHQRVLVLEDLHEAGYDRPPERLAPCVDWLARFHAAFLGRVPNDLWPEGTYWHLGTRRDEHARMPEGALKDEAEALDAALKASPFQTLLHGDAKPANFLSDGRRVAGYDFQYVGGGPGIRDLAYLLRGGNDAPLVDRYFSQLRVELAGEVDADALEADWRARLPVAERDYRRFLAGWTR